MASIASIIHSDPEILGGVPVFVGTRVPVKNLLDYLEAGDSLDSFVEDFPSVTREQAVAALELAKKCSFVMRVLLNEWRMCAFECKSLCKQIAGISQGFRCTWQWVNCLRWILPQRFSDVTT